MLLLMNDSIPSEEPVVDEPEVEEPEPVDEPAAEVEEPVVDEPVVEEPEPVVEEPEPEPEPAAEEPEPVVDEPEPVWLKSQSQNLWLMNLAKQLQNQFQLSKLLLTSVIFYQLQ